MDEQQIRQIAREVAELVLKERSRPSHQSDLLPKTVKRRHIDGVIITTGLATDRPTDGGAVGIEAYFSTDTNILSIWDSVEWVEFARIPASPGAYTQTYATADRTHANSTFGAVAETAVTQTTPWGFATQAQGDAVSVELNDLGDDVTDLKQLVNALVDDLQSIGLID